MRVLVVTNDYPPRPGGVQQYLGNLVAHSSAEILPQAGIPIMSRSVVFLQA